MPIFVRDDISINYQITGSGPRLLFFNGSGATLETSALLIRALSSVCEVLSHDQRGLGATSVPDGPYTMAQYAQDADALLQHVGWDTCALFGISFGGMAAQEFAVTYGKKVTQLVLLCTSAGGAAGSSYPLHTLDSLATEEATQKRIEITDTRFTAQWLRDNPTDAEIARAIEQRSDVTKSTEQIKGESLQLAARAHHDVADRLHFISCPTFVTAGRFDGIAPVANSEEIVKRIPHAVLKVYEGGHSFLMQDRSAIADIRTFLTDITLRS